MSKILVIDDDPDLRETLLIMLEEQGHDVILAEDGVSGIAAYAAHDPDVVITDITMPNMNGLDAIEAIMAHRRDAKIIAISGATDGKEFLVLGAHWSGARCFLPKPFEIDDLMQRVNGCLGTAS